MGKTRDLFKKIRDTKGTFHAKTGSLIKDRNGMDLTKAEDIKKRWQEYTEKLYKKDLHDPDNHDDVITHLEEARAGIKIAGRNINNFRYADDTTLMAESEEELQSLFFFLFYFIFKLYITVLVLPKPLDESESGE